MIDISGAHARHHDSISDRTQKLMTKATNGRILAYVKNRTKKLNYGQMRLDIVTTFHTDFPDDEPIIQI
jgi:hypothetical protein